MSDTYRVVTRNIGDTYTVMFEGTKQACWKFVEGRWGHRPPFAAVTKRTSNFESLF